MMSCRAFVPLLTLTMVTTAVYGSGCVSAPTCSCDFAGEENASTTKSEMLAGAVGAMSPLLAAGAGLGIYKFVQSRMAAPKLGFERAPSDLTDDSFREAKQKKFSRGRRNSTTPLQTDTSDFNSSRRGSNVTTLSVTDYDDWDVDSDRGMPSGDMDDPMSYMGSTVSTSEVSPRITPSFQSPPATVKKDNINTWMF
ncbi:uncharacterized protein LOC110442681 [Mizuhopecten yessoensis]|uniref:Uncharacterized protein n=1 Tax=Mizuhopecten yessoensis TaxID=6573 RepID=A0A210PGP8_MIZYE|nr:uncharacterized protein LOC110442681 [Mizuhopecten yessoensis]OWF35658.1 hypothetical protein KP79_PYT09738 [Mizuhopecten yessoensis]